MSTGLPGVSAVKILPSRPHGGLPCPNLSQDTQPSTPAALLLKGKLRPRGAISRMPEPGTGQVGVEMWIIWHQAVALTTALLGPQARGT